MFLLLQASAYASEDGVLTESIVDERVRDAVNQRRKKNQWETEADRAKMRHVHQHHEEQQHHGDATILN